MPVGVIANCMSVLLGGLIGARLGKRIPSSWRQALPTLFGIVAMTMGIIKISTTGSMLAVTSAVLIGGIIGEWIGIDKRLRHWIECKYQRNMQKCESDVSEYFILGVVAFCLSGTGIFGALEEGFTKDSSILFTKAGLDFFTAILLGSMAGISVALLSIPQALLMLLLYLLGSISASNIPSSVSQDFLAVGGVITMMNGFSMAGIGKMKPVNAVPSLLLVFVTSTLLR